MVADKDALICDLAETYGIYDIESLPIMTVATLSIGLKGNSRIKMIMSGQKIEIETVLLASVLDRLSFLAWTKTKDAQNNRNRPNSVLATLLNENHSERNFEIYESGEDLINRLEELRRGSCQS